MKKVRLLCTEGNGEFKEILWMKPSIGRTEIEVKAVLTGVCRSDIDMMNGEFGPLPINMHGHEGVGIVTKVGKYITDVNVGDYVATRGEPAYADYYNVRNEEYVKIPELSPKYILEPVACGINVVKQNREGIRLRCGPGKRCLILGSGFLAWVAYKTLMHCQIFFEDITVIGKSNKEMWGDVLSTELKGQYDLIIDLTSRTDYLDGEHVANEALIIMGTDKQINQSFGPLLWKAVTISFPSPRTKKFHFSMLVAEQMITSGVLCVDQFWSKCYNRETEWQQAFADANNRLPGYGRGYIKWEQ